MEVKGWPTTPRYLGANVLSLSRRLRRCASRAFGVGVAHVNGWSTNGSSLLDVLSLSHLGDSVRSRSSACGVCSPLDVQVLDAQLAGGRGSLFVDTYSISYLTFRRGRKVSVGAFDADLGSLSLSLVEGSCRCGHVGTIPGDSLFRWAREGEEMHDGRLSFWRWRDRIVSVCVRDGHLPPIVNIQ